MKKFIVILVMLALLLSATGCGNMGLGCGNYTYAKVHVDTYHYSGCFTIISWYDGDMGIEVNTEEAGSMFLSEGTYILLDGSKPCPFCG